MYRCIYQKLLSFRENICCTSDTRNKINQCLHDEIKGKSKNDLEYHFFLTRLYFISFYHALICHTTYLKHTSKQQNDGTGNSANTSTHANSQHTSKQSETMPVNFNCAEGQIQKHSHDFDTSCHGGVDDNGEGLNTQPKHEKKYPNSIPDKHGSRHTTLTSSIVKSTPLDTQDCGCSGDTKDSTGGQYEYAKLSSKSSYRIKFQKKLYRYLVMKTHPDKTKGATSQLFIEAKMIHQDGYLAILFILAVAFGYNKKLSPIELELIHYSTAEMIQITESIYHSVPPDYL